MNKSIFKKSLGLMALVFTLASCNKVVEEEVIVQPEENEGITITAQLAPKTAVSKAVADNGDGKITSTWAVGEYLDILYEISGTKYSSPARITAVDGTTGAATIEFTVESSTPDNTSCTLIYPLYASKGDNTGVKDASTLLAEQNGTLSIYLDVRVGAGTIQTTTPGLTVTTQPAAQFAIFKFTTKNATGSANIDVSRFTIITGGQDYAITPDSATSELYVALPAISSQSVVFTAAGSDNNVYQASFPSISFAAGYYYQSPIKMTSMQTTPLTMEATTSGNIRVNMSTGNIKTLDTGMKYAVNGGEKTLITTTTEISVSAGDKVQFYCNGTSTNCYGGDTRVVLQGTAQTRVYGNIMSLLNEEEYATMTNMPDVESIFRYLFMDNTNLTDASGLLLPAMTLRDNCYWCMFYGCTALKTVPDLPATMLAEACYFSMFGDCTSIKTAPKLPAPTLADYCYEEMFDGCSNLETVICLATDISANHCTRNWLSDVAEYGTIVSPTSSIWTFNSDSSVPTGWSVVILD